MCKVSIGLLCILFPCVLALALENTKDQTVFVYVVFEGNSSYKCTKTEATCGDAGLTICEIQIPDLNRRTIGYKVGCVISRKGSDYLYSYDPLIEIMDAD